MEYRRGRKAVVGVCLRTRLPADDVQRAPHESVRAPELRRLDVMPHFHDTVEAVDMVAPPALDVEVVAHPRHEQKIYGEKLLSRPCINDVAFLQYFARSPMQLRHGLSPLRADGVPGRLELDEVADLVHALRRVGEP